MGGVTSVRRLRARREKGFVLALFCIAIMAMLAFAAFCVDLGNWYFHIQLEQRAADSASLAGAAYLPGDPTSGTSDSTSVLKIDGFDLTKPGITATIHPVADHPEQMYVSVTQKVNNVFLSIFGWHSINLTRVSIAINRPPMLFGSPDNVLGEEPAGVDASGGPATWGNPALTQGDYFLQVSAPGSLKANGAEWTAASCYPNQNLNTGFAASGAADLCNSGAPIPNGSSEFDKTGDSFKLHVPSGVSGSMAVDLYDPSFVDTETLCDDGIGLPADPTTPWMTHLPVNGNPDIWEFDPAGNKAPNFGAVLDPPAEKYCSGDREELNGNIPRAFNTRYWVTYPGTTNVVPGCDVTYGGWEPQYDNISDITTPDTDPTSIYNTFHKWARMCNIQVGGANATGDYLLHVNVPYPQNGGIPVGTNDYSIRIGILNGSTVDPQSYQLQIYNGGNRMEATSLSSGTAPQYYLGQITPDKAGQTIKIRYFDLADNADMVLHIHPPADATVNGSSISEWPSCNAAAYNGVTEGPAMPAPNCSVVLTNREYDGTTIEMEIHVPVGYSCGIAGNPDDCWFQATQDYTNISGNGLNGLDDYWSVSSNFETTNLHIIH